MTAGSHSRAAAARVIVAVAADGKSLSAVLPEAQARLESERDRSLLAALSYGSIRWYPRLAALVDGMLDRPVKTNDKDVLALMIVGLFQLLYTRIPAHAAVSATVGATRVLGKAWARGLVNAVLRRFQRERVARIAAADQDETSLWAHPQWLIDAIRDDWPAAWQQILAANNSEPPMWIRVATGVESRDSYQQRLDAALGTGTQVSPWAGDAIRLDVPAGVAELPGFDAGVVSVQDAGAQLAAYFLDAEPGMRVLDACAAPGGKTAHMLQRAGGNLRVTAIDLSAGRLERVAENLRRVSSEAHLLQADATRPESWWDGLAFDRILLDAPCTASGVIRRHPDIKLLRQPGDIAAMALLQRRLLDALWPLLRPGGRMVYCTCSVFLEENEKNIAAFVAATADARVEPSPFPFAQPPWQPTPHGFQILPGDADMDGFYYACLTRNGEPG